MFLAWHARPAACSALYRNSTTTAASTKTRGGSQSMTRMSGVGACHRVTPRPAATTVRSRLLGVVEKASFPDAPRGCARALCSIIDRDNRTALGYHFNSTTHIVIAEQQQRHGVRPPRSKCQAPGVLGEERACAVATCAERSSSSSTRLEECEVGPKNGKSRIEAVVAVAGVGAGAPCFCC